MEKGLTKLGVDAVGEVPWGTHLCLFYADHQDLVDFLVPYFRAGFTGNELCLWITSEPLDKEAAVKTLRESITDLDRYLDNVQMEIIPYSAWYPRDGSPDLAGATRAWHDKFKQARSRGYEGMRVIGTTAWPDDNDWHKLMEYEMGGNNAEGRIISVCAYPLGRCDIPEVIDIVSCHQFSLIKREGKWDCFERREHKKIEERLNKSVKELRCLYDITSITGAPDTHLPQRFTEIVDILPRAFQFPQFAFARISINGAEFKTGNYRKTDHRITADIIVNGAKAGDVEVGYTEVPSSAENGLFSIEERLLLDAVAERLGTITEHRQMEDALRESEEKFSTAFRSSPDMMILTRVKDGKFLEVNDSFTRFTGYKREELIGRTSAELGLWAEPGDRNKMLKILERQGRVHNEEFDMRIKSGEIRTWRFSAEPINVGGEPCLISTNIDITERKRVEEALRKSEERFSKAFHSSPDIITISTLEDGRFIEVNDSFTRISGYTREELIGRRSIEVGTWIDASERARMLKILKKRGRVRNREVEFLTKSGEIRNGLLSAELINIGDEQCIIAIVTDTTEQRRSQELLQTVSHSSPLGIYIMQDDRFQYTNPQFQAITGYSEKELLGQELLNLVAVEDSDVVRSSTVFTLQEASPYPCEYRILTKTGQIKWVMQTVSPIHYQGQEAILGNIMDITERKYLERKVIEYEELSKIKSDLLATVSHELRTPLATIKGYSTMILDYFAQLGSGEMQEYLKSIDHSTDRLAKLVDNLLDTSRLEAGLLKLELASTNVSELVKAVADEASIRAGQHRIVLTMNRKLPRVNIDAKRIRQVLDNLVDNAIKYSPPGTEVLISVRQTSRGILFSITDQGSGIPPDELTNIFDRMYRIEQRLYSGAEGIGLGLYICQRLVEAHGGKIWAESTIGQGSTIQFLLPISNWVKLNRKKTDGAAYKPYLV